MSKIILKILPFLILTNTFSHGAIITKIVDGDTIYAKEGEELIKVRFHCIDTPESKMMGKQKAQIVDGVNYGQLATEYLKTIISVGDNVNLKCFKSDRYGRSVCEVWKNGFNVNYKMISNGYAFLPTKYCKDINYKNAFENARNMKLGLHNYDGFKDPQDFRNCVRNKTKADCNK